LGAWADYFEDLATPSEQQSFDSTFLTLVNDDVDILTEIFTKDRQPMHEVTEEELSKCIPNFKNPSTQYRHWIIKSFIIYFQDWCILRISHNVVCLLMQRIVYHFAH
jgi:hypothetical protein